MPAHSKVKTRNVIRLLRIMAKLRSPDGCPWDREQTHRTLRPYLIEECYEACDAIDAGDDESLREELGDVLLQVVFHAQLAAEAGRFDFADVAAVISEKLVRRHPHVFGKGKLRTSDEVLKQWDVIKKGEKQTLPASVLAGVPRSLPALQKAEKIQRKAAKVGFDWRNADDVIAKIEEELGELRAAKKAGNRREYAAELGDILFAAVNLARFEEFEAEDLLNQTTRKFIRRFEHIEKAVRREGRRLEECTLEELDAHWEAAKKRRAEAPARRRRRRGP